jgi:hypothetical protein
MKSVGEDGTGIEHDLERGLLHCPDCTGRLLRWGWARPRTVRTAHGAERVQPRRARCASCRRTHVLLPDWLLLRRADTADVIGAALVAHTRSAGYRRIARAIGRPASTVRDWLRRWRLGSPALATALGTPSTSPTAAVHAVYAAAEAAGRPAVWSHAARLTGGRLLATPVHPVVPRQQTAGSDRGLGGTGA